MLSWASKKYINIYLKYLSNLQTLETHELVGK